MISQQLLNGLSSHEHQLRLLEESDELKTLDARVNRLIRMEKKDDTYLRIRIPSQVNAGMSNYSKNNRKSAGIGMTHLKKGKLVPKNEIL